MLKLSIQIVKNYVIKYRSSAASITLLCYLFILSINIFHFHNLEINTKHIFDLTNDSNPQGQTINSEFHCIIHQNFNSLHAFTLQKPTPNKICLLSQIITVFCSDQVALNNLIFSSNKLRAPPSFSWFWNSLIIHFLL